jgi:hypothetical protein
MRWPVPHFFWDGEPWSTNVLHAVFPTVCFSQRTISVEKCELWSDRIFRVMMIESLIAEEENQGVLGYANWQTIERMNQRTCHRFNQGWFLGILPLVTSWRCRREEPFESSRICFRNHRSNSIALWWNRSPWTGLITQLNPNTLRHWSKTNNAMIISKSQPYWITRITAKGCCDESWTRLWLK